jgi:hypothetical protein
MVMKNDEELNLDKGTILKVTITHKSNNLDFKYNIFLFYLCVNHLREN